MCSIELGSSGLLRLYVKLVLHEERGCICQLMVLHIIIHIKLFRSHLIDNLGSFLHLLDVVCLRNRNLLAIVYLSGEKLLFTVVMVLSLN